MTLAFSLAELAEAAAAARRLQAMRQQAEAFAQALDDATGVVEFLDVPTGDLFALPPEQAMAYFRAKGLRPTFSYADMMGAAHDQAFTVAKMMDLDMLGQVRASLDSALANGTSFKAWAKDLEPLLKAGGWWGQAMVEDPATGLPVQAQLGSAWRLETIFRTNMQSSYAAGAWAEIEANAEDAPFLLYDAVDDFRTRQQHRGWDKTVLPVGHHWWRTHYPPNGYNCRCGVIQLDADQLQAMGLKQRDPPDEGTYRWKNPRTGDVIRVPDGIDPGFDRIPGTQAGTTREILAEKIEQAPPSQAKAVREATRREFDPKHEAGLWHGQAMDKAPGWLRDVALDQQFVEVQATAPRAWALLGRTIDMDTLTKDTARGQSVWRHEFGHILDVRLGSRAQQLYRSSAADFTAAAKDDAERLVVASGNARPSKAATAARAEVQAAYARARDQVVDLEREQRLADLAKRATAAGLELKQFLQVVRASTLILEGTTPDSFGAAVRLARMLEAIRLRDGEGFLRFAAGMDTLDEELAREGRITGEARRFVGESWRRDGALASLSDLIGAITRNKATSYNRGFPGHSDRYYKDRPGVAGPTEAFANLTSLAGHPLPGWWAIAQRITPQLAQLFEQIIREAGGS